MMGMAATAASNDYERMVRDLESAEHVSTITVSKEAFALVEMLMPATDLDEQARGAATSLSDNLEVMKVLVCRNSKSGQPFAERIKAYLPEGRFDLVDASEYGLGKGVQVLVRRRLATVREAHVILPGGDHGGTLVSFFGNFKLKDIKRLADSSTQWNVR